MISALYVAVNEWGIDPRHVINEWTEESLELMLGERERWHKEERKAAKKGQRGSGDRMVHGQDYIGAPRRGDNWKRRPFAQMVTDRMAGKRLQDAMAKA